MLVWFNPVAFYLTQLPQKPYILAFFKRTVPEFKIYQHESMNYYFFVLIFLSQQILGLSETQFDRVFNQNYHSKSRHVSARSWKSLKITRLKFNHWTGFTRILVEPKLSPISKRMKHISFDTGDAFQNLSLMLLKLADHGNRQPWRLSKIGPKWFFES